MTTHEKPVMHEPDSEPIDLHTRPAPDIHPDPITGEPGSHPVGTGIGAAGAGVAGAAIGVAGGPVGSIVGATVGAIVGGLIGKGVAEGIDPTAEGEYWRLNYPSRPYYDSTFNYDQDYEPAYRYGWETRKRHHDRKYGDMESELASGWTQAKGKSRLEWDKASHAVRDAWHRIEQRVHHHH